MQHINGKGHDRINQGQHCIFRDDAGLPGLGQGEAEQPAQGLRQAQVLLLLAAGVEEGAQRAGIVMTALLKGQKDIAAHDNGDVADDAVKIPQLGFPLEVEVVFQRLEEHFDVPPFAVDADNLLVGQVDPGRQDGQPLALVAVANEDDFHLLLLLRLDHRAGQDARPAGPLFQLVEHPAQGQPLPVVPVKHLGQVLAHANDRQEFAQTSQDRRKGKPTIHEQVVGPDAPRLDPFHHGFQVPGGLGHGLHPAPVAAAALVHLLGDALEPLARLGGRAQGEVKRQEAHPVGPAEREEFEPLQAPADVVVMHPGKQFDHLGAGAVIEAVVDDQHFFPLLAGQHVHEPHHHGHQAEQEFPPVIAGVLEELVGGILPESQPRVADNAPGKVGPDKRQGEDGGEHGQRRCPAQFADVAAAQQGADPEIFQEGRDPVLQSFCLLLLLVVSGRVHLSLFFLILLRILANPMYQKAKGSSR